MTTELEKKIEEVAAEPEKAGLEKTRSGWGPDGSYCFKFTVPSKRRRVYLGTYLNPFSVCGWDGKSPLLWSDEWTAELPEATVDAVYRHNGSKDDKSVAVRFTGWHTSVRPFPTKWDYERENKPEYCRVVREEAPFYYVDEKEPLSVCVSGTEIRLAKLGLKAGKKAIANAVAKALEAVEGYEPLDHSAYAKDPKDYHADTTAEYRKWQDEERKRRDAAV